MGRRPIFVVNAKKPKVVLKFLPKKYVVTVTCLKTNRLNQLAYQFAHELFHVFTVPHLVDDPFCEVLATTASLLCLKFLGNFKCEEVSRLHYSNDFIQSITAYLPRFSKFYSEVTLEGRALVDAGEIKNIRATVLKLLNKEFSQVSKAEQIGAAVSLESLLSRRANWKFLCDVLIEIENFSTGSTVLRVQTIPARFIYHKEDRSAFLERVLNTLGI